MGISAIGVYNLISELGCTAASNSLLGADTGCSGGKKLLWLTAAVAPYVYGIIDAPKSAARANARISPTKRVSIAVQGEPGGRIGLGLTTNFR
jgi:hypothetical protein